LIRDLEEIWTQNSINGPSDRTLTIRALLKGESLTAFETALEDVPIDPDPNVNALQSPMIEHIGHAMDQVSNAVFPHRALEIQKLWMVQGMKKPYDLSTRNTAAANTKINKCLPVFPLGSPASKFTDQEVVGLLEWSLLATWRKKLDLDGYVPTLGTKAKLILECEAIEQNESVNKKERKDDDHNNNNYKKTSLEIPGQELKKMNTAVAASSIARTAALTAHMLLLSVIF
jgi:hypothetical protein